MTTAARVPHRSRFSRAGLLLRFAAYWCGAGYVLGTMTLLGPVRWITGRLRQAGASQRAEDAAVVTVVVLLALLSAAAGALLVRLTGRTTRRAVRLAVPALLLAAVAGAVLLWMSPRFVATALGTGGGVEELHIPAKLPARPVPSESTSPAAERPGTTAERATEAEQETGTPAAPPAGAGDPAPRGGLTINFGPYPDAARLEALAREGYDGVISLLHPAVVPFEPKLIADEKAAAERAGIRFIHVPMLPWLGANDAALAKLAEIARDGSGRYYVHCYLGRDRVRLARAAIERAARREISIEMPAADEPGIEGGLELERGRVYALGGGVYLGPYMTEDELLRYLVPGRWGAVVSLMDARREEDAPWIARERELLGKHRIRLVELPLAADPVDPEAVLAAVRAIRPIDRPLYVHGFLSPSTGRAPAAEAFLASWRSGLPAVAPGLLRGGLDGGAVSSAAPNVLFGPRPRPREFGRLYLAGVRHALYIGPEPGALARSDAEAAALAPIAWKRSAVPVPDRLIDEILAGGTWYLYGPGAEGAAGRIAALSKTRRAGTTPAAEGRTP